MAAVVRPALDSAAKGLFLRAGLTSYKVTTDVRGVNITGGSTSESGTGYLLGVGYDLPMGPGDWRFSLTSLSKVGGDSDNSSTAFSVGYLWKF